ncbi:MAG: porin [Candidatus Methylomirabilales bacterium]
MDKTDRRDALCCRRSICALFVATLIPVAAGAVTDQDLTQIRESIRQLERRHAADQARIGDLERRLKEAETKLQEAGTAAPPTAAVADKPAEPEPPAIKALTPVSGLGGNITFTPGFRVHGRYSYDDATDNNDFFLRRFRLKAKGEAFGLAKYYGEIRFDNTRRFGTDQTIEVESAWVDFPVLPQLYVLAGQYDVPFSRNLLTSDSKLLLMDRSLITDELSRFGLVDNTIGLWAHGRPFGGLFEYAVGIFDNRVFELGASGTRESDEVMPAGRIVLNLLDPPTSPDGFADYWASYLGEGQRLAIGFNGAYLGSARDGPNEFDLLAYGADLFFNTGLFTFEAEYDRYEFDSNRASPDREGDGWFVQAGYLFHRWFELVGRHQEADRDILVSNGRSRWTSVGFNTYLGGHNLKIQTDYTFKDERVNDIGGDNMFQVQLQFDY